MEKITVLVPTDFSSFAKNALEYAISFSQEYDAKLILLHVIVYNDSSFIGSSSREEENLQRYNTAKEKMDETSTQIKKLHPSADIKCLLEGGGESATIKDIITRENVDYVIMGTHGASGVKSILVGSFTSHTIKISPCPVFTIPPSSTYKSIKHIVCATELHKSEIPAIEQVISFADQSKASVTFMNVDDDPTKQKEKLELFRKQLNVKKEAAINFELKNSSNIVETIDDYVCEINPDLLVTLGREKSFLDKVLGLSISKNLCMYTLIPLLSFPAFKNKS